MNYFFLCFLIFEFIIALFFIFKKNKDIKVKIFQLIFILYVVGTTIFFFRFPIGFPFKLICSILWVLSLGLYSVIYHRNNLSLLLVGFIFVPVIYFKSYYSLFFPVIASALLSSIIIALYFLVKYKAKLSGVLILLLVDCIRLAIDSYIHW
jgi:hypothetical protein